MLSISSELGEMHPRWPAFSHLLSAGSSSVFTTHGPLDLLWSASVWSGHTFLHPLTGPFDDMPPFLPHSTSSQDVFSPNALTEESRCLGPG